MEQTGAEVKLLQMSDAYFEIGHEEGGMGTEYTCLQLVLSVGLADIPVIILLIRFLTCSRIKL